MEILAGIVLLIIFWLVTSDSKTEDIKLFFKKKKEFENSADRVLGDLEQSSKIIAEDSKKESKKNKIENLRSNIVRFINLNKELRESKLEEVDVSGYINELKVIGGYEEVASIVKMRDFNLNSLIKNDDYKELQKNLKDFIKIRYYLTGMKSYPYLDCIYDLFATQVPGISNEYCELVWYKITDAIYFDEKQRKNIKHLYHFTHINNLKSILQHGFLTRNNLDNNVMEYSFNDSLRLDGVTDSISLSISHPNYKMFYKYRKLTNDNDWVVISISPQILYGKQGFISKNIKSFNYLNKAIFCKKNAATNEMRNLSIPERKTCEAFLDMFKSTTDRNLDTYTYDNQAEILYQGNIPVDFIDEIHVLDKNNSFNWIEDLGFTVSENKTVFSKR